MQQQSPRLSPAMTLLQTAYQPIVGSLSLSETIVVAQKKDDDDDNNNTNTTTAPQAKRAKTAIHNNPGKLRFGIMSTANISRKIARAILNAPSAELVAVASRDRLKAESFCTDLELPVTVKAMGSYDELIQCDEVDAIYLPLPRSISTEWAVKVANAGKHLLLEKPCANSLEDYRKIVEACMENNVILMDGVMFVHHERTLRLVERLHDPRTGEVLRVSANFSFNGGAQFHAENIRVKASGDPLGVLGDLGWYCCRIGLHAFGSTEAEFHENSEAKPPNMRGRYRPVSVIARSHRSSHEGVVTDMDAEVTFESDTSSLQKILHFHASFHMPFRERVEIVTTHKIITMEDFVIPDNETCASFTVRHFPSNGQALLDTSESLVFRDEVVNILNSTRQEVSMIETFSCVALLNPRDKSRQQITKEWITEAAYTQALVDACLESMNHHGSIAKIERL